MKLRIAIPAALLCIPGAALADRVSDTLKVGANPSAVAVNPVTHTAYVANTGSHSISVIDALTGRIIATVPVDSAPVAVAVNPLTDRIYVANRGGNSVSVIEGGTHKVTPIPVGNAPCGLAVDGATNRIYVANRGSNSVTRIHGITLETAVIPVGLGPMAVAVNPVTGKIYTADSAGNTITEIRGGGPDTASIPTGSGPVALCINPVTNTIYAANAAGNTVTALDGATLSASSIAVGVNPVALAVNPATNTIYVANRSNLSLTVIDGVTRAATAVFVGNTPVAVAVNAATGKVYVANQLGRSLTVIRASTLAKQTLTVPGGPSALGLDPLLNRIYAIHSSGEVSVIEGAADDTVKVDLKEQPSAAAPVVNPITNKIYVATRTGVTELDGGTHAETKVMFADSIDCLAVNPATNRVYASLYSGQVVVADRKQGGSTVINIEEGLFRMTPGPIAINVVTNKIYVADRMSEFVTVIDGATNAWTRIKSGSGQPDAIAVNPATNKVYVANWGSVAVIDGASNAVTNLPVYSSSNGIAVNPRTNRIYVPLYQRDTVAIIDGETGAVAKVATDSMPFAIAVNPNSGKVYVTHNRGSSILVLDGSANPKATRIPIPLKSTDAISVNPVTNRIYAASVSGSAIVMIDGATDKAVLVPMGAFSGGIGVNPVTGKVYKPDGWDVGSRNILSIFTEEPHADTRLGAILNAPTDAFVYSARPALAGKGVNRLRPGRSGLAGVGIGLGTLRKPWTWALLTSGAGTDSVQWQWDGGGDTLAFGENFLVATAVDSQVAAGHLGSGMGWIGNQAVFPIYRMMKPPLTAPAPQAPMDSVTSGVSPQNFSWSAVPEAEYYVLQFSKTSWFETVYSSQRVYGTSKAMELEAAEKGAVDYWWRVNAANTGGAGAWSKARKFTLGGPAKPVIRFPNWAAQDQPLALTIAWAPVPTAIRYQFEFSPTYQITPDWHTSVPILFRDTLLTDTARALSGLATGTTYSFRIRAGNTGNLWSLWAAGSFTTAGVAGAVADPALPRAFSLRTGAGHIRYALPMRCRVRLKLYDQMGRLAAAPVDADQAPGYHSLPLRAAGLTRGVYLIRIEAGSWSQRGTVSWTGE